MNGYLFFIAFYGIMGGYLGAKHTRKYPWQVKVSTYISWIYGWPIMLMKGK